MGEVRVCVAYLLYFSQTMMASILARKRVVQCCNPGIPKHKTSAAIVARCFATNNASQNEVDKFSSFASNWW